MISTLDALRGEEPGREGRRKGKNKRERTEAKGKEKREAK